MADLDKLNYIKKGRCNLLKKLINKFQINMKNMKKGFTLIELLIVIAIIGILAGVILVSTSSARQKAKISAFKSETRSAVSGLLSVCIDTTPITVPADTANTDYAALTQSCGPAGANTFSVNATPLPAITGCSAAISETGVVYTGC